MRPTIPIPVLLSLALLPAAAATAEVTVERPFALLAENGDATSWTLHPTAAGAITAEATWSGGARLTLALEGPGKSGHLTRRTGTSPLTLRFPLSAEQLQGDGEWRLTLFNFSGRPAQGTVEATWPDAAPPAAGGFAVAVPRERPRVQAVRPRDREARFTVAGSVAAPGGSATGQPPVPLAPPGGTGEPRRTVLPDGRVRLDYPDGSAVIFDAGCGKTMIAADGTQTRLTCQQVQGAGLPPPPGDPAFNGFLGNHEESLLQQIRFLVGHDAQAVANYMALETGETASVVERIDLRRRYVDRLLGIGM